MNFPKKTAIIISIFSAFMFGRMTSPIKECSDYRAVGLKYIVDSEFIDINEIKNPDTLITETSNYLYYTINFDGRENPKVLDSLRQSSEVLELRNNLESLFNPYFKIDEMKKEINKNRYKQLSELRYNLAKEHQEKEYFKFNERPNIINEDQLKKKTGKKKNIHKKKTKIYK